MEWKKPRKFDTGSCVVGDFVKIPDWKCTHSHGIPIAPTNCAGRNRHTYEQLSDFVRLITHTAYFCIDPKHTWKRQIIISPRGRPEYPRIPIVTIIDWPLECPPQSTCHARPPQQSPAWISRVAAWLYISCCMPTNQPLHTESTTRECTRTYSPAVHYSQTATTCNIICTATSHFWAEISPPRISTSH